MHKPPELAEGQDGWVKYNIPMDGGGQYRCKGVVYKIVKHIFVGGSQVCAYLDGKEVAKGSTFPIMRRRLERL